MAIQGQLLSAWSGVVMGSTPMWMYACILYLFDFSITLVYIKTLVTYIQILVFYNHLQVQYQSIMVGLFYQVI